MVNFLTMTKNDVQFPNDHFAYLHMYLHTNLLHTYYYFEGNMISSLLNSDLRDQGSSRPTIHRLYNRGQLIDHIYADANYTALGAEMFGLGELKKAIPKTTM